VATERVGGGLELPRHGGLEETFDAAKDAALKAYRNLLATRRGLALAAEK
jgi:hypothetical protein